MAQNDRYADNVSERQMLIDIAFQLDKIHADIATIESRVDSLIDFADGLVNGISAAKKSGGMTGMMAGMLPSIPSLKG